MTIHLEKLNLGTNGKQELMRLSHYFPRSFSPNKKIKQEWQKQMESDLSGLLMNCHSRIKSTTFSLPALHFSFLEKICHTQPQNHALSIRRSVCMRAGAVRVFAVQSHLCFQLKKWTKACKCPWCDIQEERFCHCLPCVITSKQTLESLKSLEE